MSFGNARAPGGETMLRCRHGSSAISKIWRCDKRAGVFWWDTPDLIKSALPIFSGAAIDFMPRLEIAPASISAVVLGRNEPRLFHQRDLIELSGPGA